MQLSKNKKYQYSFFFILTIYTIFNGGNSNLSIQINFILVSFLFLFCLKDKNYNFFWESIFILERKKYKIAEIPIILPNRTLGSSKMRFTDVFYGIFYLFKIFIFHKL